MAGYKIATYQTAEGPRAGIVVDDKLFDAAKLTGRPAYATVLGILKDWRTAQGILRTVDGMANIEEVARQIDRVLGQPA